MTKAEQARRAHQTRALMSLGFTDYEAAALRRIALPTFAAAVTAVRLYDDIRRALGR